MSNRTFTQLKAKCKYWKNYQHSIGMWCTLNVPLNELFSKVCTTFWRLFRIDRHIITVFRYNLIIRSKSGKNVDGVTVTWVIWKHYHGLWADRQTWPVKSIRRRVAFETKYIQVKAKLKECNCKVFYKKFIHLIGTTKKKKCHNSYYANFIFIIWI